jgi:hypothetical protein
MLLTLQCHLSNACATPKGTWAGKPFDLIDWQEKIIRDIFGILKARWLPSIQHCLCRNSQETRKSELAAASPCYFVVPMVKNGRRFMAVQLIGNRLRLFLTWLLIWYG